MVRKQAFHGLACSVCLLLAGAIVPPSAANAQEKSLFDRLGGLAPISVVVSDLIDALKEDSLLNANPAIDAARTRVPASYLKYHVTALVCETTGGPCTYHGRSMKASHAHLKITEREWDRMVSLLTKVLTKHGVPAAEQKEILAIVESTKADIVMPHSMD